MTSIHPVLCFVAGAYRDPCGAWYVQQNIQRAMGVAAELWRRGIPALSPQANSAMMDGLCPDEFFLEGALLMLARCDVLVLVPGWESSQGAQAERSYALQHEIPVFLWPEGERALLHWIAEREARAA